MSELEDIYRFCAAHPCDLDKLFPTFRDYAERCRHVTEFGVRDVFSTYAFLVARPARMVSYDVVASPNIGIAEGAARRAGVDYEFRCADVLAVEIAPTDLLFIDTKHTYAQLREELRLHAPAVKKFLLIHDTTTFGDVGEDGGPGEWRAVEEFLAENPAWRLRERLTFSNGLTVLERAS